MVPMLPRVELELWRMAQQDAEELAQAGDVTGGYECLLQGLFRAIDYSGSGEEWAADLVYFYRQALSEYAARHCQHRQDRW